MHQLHLTAVAGAPVVDLILNYNECDAVLVQVNVHLSELLLQLFVC